MHTVNKYKCIQRININAYNSQSICPNSVFDRCLLIHICSTYFINLPRLPPVRVTTFLIGVSRD